MRTLQNHLLALGPALALAGIVGGSATAIAQNADGFDPYRGGVHGAERAYELAEERQAESASELVGMQNDQLNGTGRATEDPRSADFAPYQGSAVGAEREGQRIHGTVLD